MRSPRNTYRKGRPTTIDLLLLTHSDKLKLILILKTSFTFYKTRYLNEEVKCIEPCPSVSVPCAMYLSLLSFPSLSPPYLLLLSKRQTPDKPKAYICIVSLVILQLPISENNVLLILFTQTNK
jgi:hypothetical protein